MEHKGNTNANNNGNTNNNNVDNTQRDTTNNNTRDFYMSQSEPPGTSLPGSSTSTPIVTSPFHEPIAAPVTTSSPPSSTNLTSTSSTNNTLTTTSTTTTTTTTPAAAHKTQAAFVNKLYTMVEDQSIQHLISWAPSGDVFSVSNPTEFSKSVLPQYFKHNNWQSFVRQLNMYGFHKVNDMFHANPSSESQAWEFKHPDFRRGQLLALQNIKRKSSKPANSTSIKGISNNSGTGQSPSTDTDTRDDRIDCLTTQMADMMERMRQMNESYSVLYAETVSCKMLQSKHQQVITTITNLLSSMSREDDSNDPRSLKRKFDMDLLTAEVAKLGQGDIPPPSHSPMMQHPSSHYPREHPTRSMSTPQPMVGLEHTNMHPNSPMTEIEYRPFPGSNHHRQQSKVQAPSPLAMLPEIPFTSSFQPSNNYLRHRSPEPISGVSPGNSRSASLDTYSSSRSVSISQSSTQSTSQFSQSNSHSSHMPSSLPSPPNRRSSQPASSLSFGSDSNLLNPSENNRYKDNNLSTISQSQSQQQRPPSSSSTSPTPFKSENPVVNSPSTSQTRPPPIPDPPDNNEEYAKRRKRN